MGTITANPEAAVDNTTVGAAEHLARVVASLVYTNADVADIIGAVSAFTDTLAAITGCQGNHINAGRLNDVGRHLDRTADVYKMTASWTS